MRVISLNCNGIRSAARKGFFDWLPQQRARVVCLQETKAQPADLADGEHFTPSGWWVYQNPAVKKGYSGTAIYSRLEPDAVIDRLGNEEFDNEGRFLEARFGTLSVISLYLPSGSAGPERQASKDRFLDFFMPLLTEWRSNGREYIICGDWNIAHTKLDLKNWRGNQKNSGFLPHERAWMDQLLGNEAPSLGWVDAFRALHPTVEGEGYTWWSNRGNAWANNVGWRIDYQIVTPKLGPAIKSASVYKDSRFSDHSPLIVDYDF
jgi:exodeoxyribonuclease-3